MTYKHNEQQVANQAAMSNPRPGDYWHERFCPYFLVVQVKGDKITVLNCVPNYGTSARQDVDRDYWEFDYSKAIEVDRIWIENLVQYNTISGFVADVVRNGDKHLSIVNEYIEYRAKKLLQEFRDLGPNATKYLIEVA